MVGRYAAHHFEDPGAVGREMARVCRGDGYVVLAEVVAPEEAALAANFHRMERLRNPSPPLLAESVGQDRLGVAPYRDGSRRHFSFPIEVFVGRKPGK